LSELTRCVTTRSIRSGWRKCRPRSYDKECRSSGRHCWSGRTETIEARPHDGTAGSTDRGEGRRMNCALPPGDRGLRSENSRRPFGRQGLMSGTSGLVLRTPTDRTRVGGRAGMPTLRHVWPTFARRRETGPVVPPRARIAHKRKKPAAAGAGRA
jgi:hypothetical protein